VKQREGRCRRELAVSEEKKKWWPNEGKKKRQRDVGVGKPFALPLRSPITVALCEEQTKDAKNRGEKTNKLPKSI